MGCAGGLQVRVSETDGSAPALIVGTAVVSGRTLPFSCPATGYAAAFCVGAAALQIPVDGPLTTARVLLSIKDDAGNAFNRSVTPVLHVIPDFGGPGCGTCESLSIQAVLQ
jgi:hypothetical protein